MILISKKKISKIIVLLVFFLNSCEAIKMASGITKPTMEDDLVNETPELILPPDFESRPMNNAKNSYRDRNNLTQENPEFSEQIIDNRNFVQPRTQNFMAPMVQVPLSTSPSDSIEKFSRNRKFTLGKWVYENSVNSFREGNIYYRPIYDKGYNFSRRYTPENNFINQNNMNYQGRNFQNNQTYQDQNSYDSIENNYESIQAIDEIPIVR
ncbi:hypothetical protein OA848_01545 [Rickettsiales bacterium]|nr:hypothetical protein [Rickettsiales bacterium]